MSKEYKVWRPDFQEWGNCQASTLNALAALGWRVIGMQASSLHHLEPPTLLLERDADSTVIHLAINSPTDLACKQSLPELRTTGVLDDVTCKACRDSNGFRFLNATYFVL